jgi:membrane protease YdiL (CAAX protease family)
LSLANLLFLAMVGVFLPAVLMRNARRSRPGVVAANRSAAVHLQLLLLPAFYLPITVVTAVENELPWPRLDEVSGVVVLVAITWLAVKLLIVQLLKPWLRQQTGPVVSRLAPRLTPLSLAIFAVACIVIGTSEELAFRWVFPAVLQSLGLPLIVAFLLASLTFALWHAVQGPRGMLFAGVGGFVNHLLVLGTGTLWTPILSHVAYDFVAGVTIARENSLPRRTEPAPMEEKLG